MRPALSSRPKLPAGGRWVPGAVGPLLLERFPERGVLKSTAAAWADRAGLVLLVLAAGTLLFRPADLIPSLAGSTIHKDLVLACLLVSIGHVLHQLSTRSLRANAITAMVVLLVPAVVTSHLSHGDTYDARVDGLEMAKACVFFLLVVGLVDSVQNFRILLGAVAAAIFTVTALAVAQYYGALHLPALESVAQHDSGSSESVVLRLCGIGVFNDPNDFSLYIVASGIVCALGLCEARTRWRWLLLLPMALFGYALILTHSRGGLLSAVAAFMVFAVSRFGWRNALMAGLVLSAVFLLPYWGRQTHLNLSDPEDTFQTRIHLWSESLELFRRSPFFGIGEGQLVDMTGQVTHNSFLHAFAEMGVFGGMAFIGAFYLVLIGLWRAAPADSELTRLRPYVLAIVAGYATGLLSLSRCYTVPTQLILALGTAYLTLGYRAGGVALPGLDWTCVRRVGAIALLFLAATYVFVRLMMHPVHS